MSDAGFDAANPTKVFAGWKDAYWSSHGPDSRASRGSPLRGWPTWS
jgi:hypothetical protein